MSPSSRAIIQINAKQKGFSKINYSRRMYAIIRRYTPDVKECEPSECFADLTGLRTFFKMTYDEIAEKIRIELTNEIGVKFTVKVSTVKAFNNAKNNSKKTRSISTYKEINKLFAGIPFTSTKNLTANKVTRRRLVVPFLGKVS